ncbi:MAG: type I-E CRISPR-associated protein Cas7/Cse4/CasC [Bifidobacteriaceae bacterium]|jgi:CRISPR system Cascade subunit CasC|nr:type I-E CRISPR-associated protein Cas7/Cse4/CasC [Bifidobacteriaceae bacterium]
MTQDHIYVDVHILQSLPPNNLNRDDTGSPKSAIYGGARRARVSSQAWKRATRKMFHDHQPPADRAIRTLRLLEVLTARLTARLDLTAELSERIAKLLLNNSGLKSGKKDSHLQYLLFFGLPQIDAIADQLAGREFHSEMSDNELKDQIEPVGIRESLAQGHPIDVALFGRMVADIPAINVDAAAQVGHALSTHAVETEFDYFTAVDDENPREETGAGMIGTVEYNSATYYRFASVAVHLLRENLSGSWEAALDALDSFVEAFALSVPSGHVTTFAHRTRPALVAVVVRTDQPVNLVSAFEVPVWSQTGVLSESMTRLAQTFAAESDRWDDAPLATMASWDSSAARSQDQATLDAAFGSSLKFEELRAALRAALVENGPKP